MKLTKCQAEVARILDEEIFTGPERWIRKYFACNARGLKIDYRDTHAVAFCVMGARRKAEDIYYNRHSQDEYCSILTLMQNFGMNPSWNDKSSTTFADVKVKLAKLRALPIEEDQ